MAASLPRRDPPRRRPRARAAARRGWWSCAGGVRPLFGYLARRAEELHAALPPEASWSARVRREIGACLAHREPRLSDIAKRLGASERTLHRRLEAEDTNFATLLDDARRERALLLVEDPALSIGELAFLIGYSEPAAFIRAFKRWTSETPTGYRANTVRG